jgi:tRNA threonylcarbamoyladenosine biosynthesis protein TsaE
LGSSTVERSFVLRSEAETEALAAALARNLVPGDRIAVFGDLGAGKTVFVRGLARGLGHPDPRDVVSPTFAIHHRYPGGRIPLDHVDLYRLAAPVTLAREGLDDVVSDPRTVLCCEWPERLGAPLPDTVLEVAIAWDGPDRRRVTLRPRPDVAARLLGALPAHGADPTSSGAQR